MADKKPTTIGEILDNPDAFPEEAARIEAFAQTALEAMSQTEKDWQQLVSAYAKAKNISREEAEQQIYRKANADESIMHMRYGEFLGRSLTPDGDLLIGGLLDTIIKKAEEENRPIAEIVEEARDALEGAGKSAFMAVPFDPALDSISLISRKNTEIKRGYAEYNSPEMRIVIFDFDKIGTALGIGADKLLYTVLAQFVKMNHIDYSAKRDEAKAENLKVYIPLKEYAIATNKVSASDADKKKQKTQLDNARKKIKKEQLLLFNVAITWEGKGKDGEETYRMRRIFDGADFENGNFVFTFSQEMADAIVRGKPISQYNIGLLAIDERRPNAYRIMKYLESHYNMLANQIKGSHNRLKIENLLAKTDLPSYEKIQETSRGHWQDRIKEPFEDNLDYLQHLGLLQDWKYTHEKGRPLSEEEARNIVKYSDFTSLYLEFEPVNTIDHSGRIEAKKQRAKKKEAAIEKEEAKIEARKRTNKK